MLKLLMLWLILKNGESDAVSEAEDFFFFGGGGRKMTALSSRPQVPIIKHS